MNLRRIGMPIFACVIVTLFFGCAVLALQYGARVTARQLSPCIWGFAIYNTSTSPGYWLCDVSFEWCPMDVAVPNGWEANWNGKDGWQWMNSPPNGGPVANSYVTATEVGIAPGQMLGGFESDYCGYPTNDSQVACIWWAEFYGSSGYASSTGSVELDNNLVPEPSCVLCLGFLLGGLKVSVSRRERRSR